MAQTEPSSRPQRIEEAIEHALAKRWDAAAKANRALLKEQPDDVETANRLGKAWTKLGDYRRAIKAYEQAVDADSMNSIARKNLARLHELHGEGAPKGGSAKKRSAAAKGEAEPPAEARAHSLVAESAKSADFALVAPNSAALKGLTAGDTAAIQSTDGGVEITTPSGTLLGTIDRRAALRLKRMIEGGNEYAVVVRKVGESEATVHIRESVTNPSLAGQASFIASAKAAKKRAGTRAYTRSSVVEQHEPDEPDPDDDDHDAQDSVATSGSGSQADEMEERGFTETRSDDDDEEDDEDDDGDDDPYEAEEEE